MSSARRLLRFFQGVREGVRIALDSLRANPFRSGLTILGIGIGVCVVVLMAALITGIRGSVQESIEAAGPQNFFVTRFDLSEVRLVGDGTTPEWLRRPPVTVEEARRIAALPEVESAVISIPLQDPGGQGGLTLAFEGTQVSGITGAAEAAAWTRYREVTFIRGRNFVPVEVDEARPVVVISQRLAQDLFGSRDPVGARVRTWATDGTSVPLTVVGVFEPAQDLFSGAVPHITILPHTTATRRLKADDQWGQVVVVPREGVPQEVVEDQVTGLMRSLRGLAPGEANDFSLLRSTQLLELFDRFTGVFFIVMLALSSVGLLVGGVGVVGIMLISVTERTREIGIRKAVGATGAEILWQFLVEAGFLTLLGGGAGLLMGMGLAAAVAAATPIPAVVPLWAAAAGLTMAAVTGMLFGLVPALRAARMEPVDALRYE
jgi:putative ABC transport system permease protein